MAYPMMEILLHLDTYLQVLVNEYSTWVYVFLFLIIFFETGIIITPFLPGDSLLFAAGALAAIGSFNLAILFAVLLLAAVLGDTANYHIGKFIGPKVFRKESSFFFRKEYIVRAQRFYEQHGKKTIILARFIPIIRTFAPFVAGIGTMPYRTFLFYNIVGALLWCGLFVFGGFFFGNLVWVQEHFGLLILGIILVSLIPMIKEIIVHLRKKKH